MDTSSAGMKSLMKRFAEMGKGDGQGMLGPMQMSQMIEKVDGTGFFWGTTPALMGGLFLNTTAFIKTADPEGYLAQARRAFEEMNKKTIEGITFTTGYQPGGAKVGETPVDVWTMKMQGDPTNPASAQIAQVQTMLFGPTGLGGYMARASNGVIVTYSKNNSLLDQALQAAKSGQGLSKDDGIAQVAPNLPAGSSFTGYMGIKNILEIGIGFLSMMPGAPVVNFEVPQDLPPVGFGAANAQGGVHSQVFIPTQVIQTVKSLVETVQKAGEAEEMGDEDAEETGQPKF
jgi:hypothetical protein